MKPSETLKDLLATCVCKNISFTGKAGSQYTAQDLMHNTTLQSLDAMYKRLKAEANNLNSDSLFHNKTSEKSALLELQVSTVKEVFLYKQSTALAAQKARETREANLKRLETLKDIKLKKEFEAMEALDKDAIEKEIALLEGA